MAQIIGFPRKPSTKPDAPASHLMKAAASAAVNSGLDRRTAADALRRVATALERRG